MNKPLADRIRPKTIDDIVGQKHLIAPGRPLRKIIESGDIPNLIFYGPSGVGKTTLATYIAKKTNRTLKKLNGTTASTADIKEIVAQLNTFSGLNGILLYLDEIQYFNKKQQQTLLEYIENGSITLIASTTENPYFYVYNAILSRSTVFEFKPVEPDEVEKAVYRASDFLAEESGTDIEMPEECAKKIASGCGGDVRKAMNAVELSVIATDEIDGKRLSDLKPLNSLCRKVRSDMTVRAMSITILFRLIRKVCVEAIPMPHFTILQDCLRQAICRVRVADLWCVRARMWDLRIHSFCRL